MAQAENSLLGLALQSGAGVTETRDAEFKYLLYKRGNVSPTNIIIPLGAEVGGGALERSMVKVGVNSSGALELIPRPETLGLFMNGVTGSYSVGVPVTGYYPHEFKLGADQFAAPYYTGRSSPGGLFGETFEDMRVNMLMLEWAGANFVTGAVSFQGGLPTPNVSMATWDALAKVDAGPQFLAPYGQIELPTGTSARVLRGSFVAMSEIPMDEQYVVGNFAPEGLDIVHRSFILQLAVKVDDEVLYNKMMYDPANGAAWTADIFRESNITLTFGSDVGDYSFTIEANGQSGANANILWSAEPLDIRARKQLVMNVTGMFIADPQGTLDPIVLKLNNTRPTYAFTPIP